MTDLTKLKELAERATPGPWTTDAAQSVIADSDQLNSGWVICECFGSDEKANRNFIKAANPAAVLELIAEVELLRGHVTDLEEARDTRVSERLALIDGLSKDAERYQAIRCTAYVSGKGWQFMCYFKPINPYAYNLRGDRKYPDIDAAIDAALEGGGR
ncbi:ead/Ea22-like family protein [Pseudomonas multiresinivorans]|uniref:Ead/Ea22-like family protein n=1 Tax=Pseudomonas multiresinivorans TaxID=95301 RepID=A0A7Z3BP91_9PSED|nr:ead/Ea22-like family protein [Pseudomonas multiresinivorans]QJP08354.1 hypothetical protein G4G71_10870 [Pseudomonas multiresinivorans]QJP10502.1 hypothetical protein G4G71_22410 [Pseudomonas multiresinivorans]